MQAGCRDRGEMRRRLIRGKDRRLLRETGGKLITIEYDPARAKTAAENIKRAGLSDVVQVIPGDAFKEIPKLTGTFDCVFVDAWKRDYIKFFEMMYPRLDKGGLAGLLDGPAGAVQ
jgi:predicted O-methyltransferase YrrM